MTSLLCVSAGCLCPLTSWQDLGLSPLCPSLCCTAPQQRVGLKCPLSPCLHMSTIWLVLPSLLLPDTRHQVLSSRPDPSPSTSQAGPPEYILKLQARPHFPGTEEPVLAPCVSGSLRELEPVP